MISATIRKAGPKGVRTAWGREASEFPSCRGGGGGRRGRGRGGCWSTNWTPAAWQYNYGLLPRGRVCARLSSVKGTRDTCASGLLRSAGWKISILPPPSSTFRHFSSVSRSLGRIRLKKKESEVERKLDDVVGRQLNRIEVVIWGILEFAGRTRLVSCSIWKEKIVNIWRKAFRDERRWNGIRANLLFNSKVRVGS